MPPKAGIIALVCLWASAVCSASGTSPADDRAYPLLAPRPSEAQRTPLGRSSRWPPALEAPRPRSQGVLPAAFELPLPESAKASGPAPSVPSPPATRPQTQGPADGKTATPRRGRAFHLPLPPPGSSKRTDGSPADKPRGGLASAVTVVGSLALVLGLFFVLAWAMRRAAPRGSTILPAEVVEVLGRAPLAGRQQVHLLRCGTKLLLVSVTPTGAETLTEITDSDEVNRLAGLCRQAHPDSATAAFRQVFGQLSRQGSVLGLLGGARQTDATPGTSGGDDGNVEGHHA